MDQSTHSWIAIRALALLKEKGEAKNLVELLKPHAAASSVGAWIPDNVDAKRGGAGSSTDNHILKMEPYIGSQTDRFVVKKADLMKHLGRHRATFSFLENDTYLDPAWWEKPYKGDAPKPGQHLPNRIMALSTMMKDVLLMGDEKVDKLIPGSISFIDYMAEKQRTPEEMAAMDFFMLSHFVADACMPCHCDGRLLAGYRAGMHKELEEHWSKIVGPAFEKKNLKKSKVAGDQILEQARKVDGKFGLTFGADPIPGLLRDHDVWLEFIYMCRASFAVASIVAPYTAYPYDNSQRKIRFADILGKPKQKLLDDLDRTVMYDAVMNTAIVWKHIWNKVSKL